MSSRLVVEKREGIKVVKSEGLWPQPAPVRWAAHFFSYLFHPVVVPVLIVWFMLYRHPYFFAGFSPTDKLKVLIQAFVMFTFFPVVTVLLLKALKFISNFHLQTQKDRIIPLVGCGIWYFWIWYVWRNLPDYPVEAVQLALAIWISASLSLLVNIVHKVSLHCIATGVLCCFFFLLALTQSLPMGTYLSVALLLTGIVASSRLIVSDHSPSEIYTGLATGIISMLIAFFAV